MTDYLRAKEISIRYGISESSVHRLPIPGRVKLGRAVLYPRDKVETYVRERKEK